MKRIRTMLTSRLLPLEELLLSKYDEHGKNAELLGYPIGDDPTGFSKGAMIRLATDQYLRARASGERADAKRERLLRFFGMIRDGEQIKTWGKMSTLKSLCALQRAGELSILDEKTLAVMKKCTDYTDFIDPETLILHPGHPTNYYHVAMECAAMREKLSFEVGTMSDRFAEKLLCEMKENSEDGWMDEVVPFGRFDTYSVNMNLVLSLAFLEHGKPIPPYLAENTKRSVRLYFALRNRRGDAFSYGRSLSLYGEFAALKHMLYGLKAGYFDGAERTEALAYALSLTEKITSFWFDENKGFFNIWLDGRATEGYRGIFRIFETNSDTCASIQAVLSLLDELEDCEAEGTISEPNEWQIYKETFVNSDKKKRFVYVLRHKADVFMLPLIGIGPHSAVASYLPFVHAPRLLESPPAGHTMPFLTPEFTLCDGECVMPAQFYDKITERHTADGIVIEAEGYCSLLNPASYDSRVSSERRFLNRYTFRGDRILVEYTVGDAVFARMICASNESVRITLHEADEIPLDVATNPDFNTPHGALTQGVLALYKGNRAAYTVQL